MKSDQSVAVLPFVLVIVIAINQINSVDSNCMQSMLLFNYSPPPPPTAPEIWVSCWRCV